MKIISVLLCFMALVSVSAQTNETFNGTSVPTPAPPPTDFPTAEVFTFDPLGATSFGWHYQDPWTRSFQHAIRRPGWSWNEPLAGYAPFCQNQTCYDVTDSCSQMGGTLLHPSYCSFPEDVKIAGPSCWQDDCQASGKEVCDSVGGVTVGQGGVEWCLFKGARTIFGPACYNE